MAVALREVMVSPRRLPESAEIGERLRALRNELGLTAREVAVGMGLNSPESYRQYEKGHIRNWAAAIPRLARGLRMDPLLLATRIEAPYDPSLTALEGRIQQVLGPARAYLVDEIVDSLADLPPELQDKAIEMMRVSVMGVRADADLRGSLP